MTTTHEVSTLSPGDAGYTEINKQVEKARLHSSRRLNWKKITKLYNGLDVGGSVILENETVSRTSNLAVVMDRRGVTRHVDYEVARVTIGSGSIKKVAITRLSEKELKEI